MLKIMYGGGGGGGGGNLKYQQIECLLHLF